jgi:hypothetical protein
MTLPIHVAAAGGRQAFVIYTPYLENINFFLKTALTADAIPSVINKQVTVKAHQRRQYPGDTALSNVPSSSREFLVDPAARSGNGLPGRSIVLVADAGLPGEERRTFTLKGRWVDFHAWLVTNAKMEINAYNNTGRKYTIEAAGTP